MKWGVREGRQEAGFRRVLALRRKTFEGIAKGGRVGGCGWALSLEDEKERKQ